MNHKEGALKDNRNSHIFYQYWLPEEDPRAILQIVHGLGEHSSRYMNVVNHFVPLGYAVYAIDHLGHGRSDGARMFVKSFEDYIDTLKLYFDMIREWNPGKPVYLVGHSMGGLIGSVYLLDHQAELNGAVISAPAVKVPDNISGALILISKIFSKLMPKLGLAALEVDGISSDPSVVQAYINDPLVYKGKTTARLGAEMIKAMQRISEEADKITLPVMILQGGADRLVDPAGAQMLYDTINSPDKKIKVYKDFFHEVFNEPEHETVLKDVEIWLEEHMSK